jgi:cytochrome c-type biogenesis protein
MISIATVLATFVAGLGSFLAPCTVPLLPAYLACVSGVSAAELTNPDRHSFRLRLLAGSLLYVAGFTVVFVLLGLTAGGIARVANGAVSGRIVEIVGGVAVILFGLAIIGVVRVGLLERTAGFQLPERLRRRGVLGAFLVGVVFGIGWTPCVGPYSSARSPLSEASSPSRSVCCWRPARTRTSPHISRSSRPRPDRRRVVTLRCTCGRRRRRA